MIESRIFSDSQGFTFALFDTCDILEYEGEALPEQLYEHNKHYTHEQTAERNAGAFLDKYNEATDAIRRSLCGYDTEIQCRRSTSSAVGRRVRKSV